MNMGFWAFAGACSAKVGQAFSTSAHVVILVSEISLFADHANDAAALQDALANARIEDRRFKARVGADEHDGVCFFNASDAGVEEIAGAAALLAQAACHPAGNRCS